MPLQARPERAEAERRILEALQAGVEPNLNAISEDLKYSIQQVRRIAKKMRIAIAKPPSVTSEKEGEVTKVISLIPPSAEKKKLEELEEKETVEAEALAEGLISSEDLKGFFQSINMLFPAKYRRPPESMGILGKLWAKPANRMIEKYSEENFDLYLAGLATVTTFAPSFAEMIRDRNKTTTETLEQRQAREKKESEARI